MSYVVPEPLPMGWEVVPFNEVVHNHSGNSKLIKGKQHSSAGGGKFPGFSASGQDVWLDDFEHEGTAIVLSAVGARCGKAFLAKGKWSAVANTHVLWPVQDALDPMFFWYLVNDENFWIRGGSGQPFVKVKASLERPFALPPLNEQRRIVAKIEALFSRLEEGVSALKQARARLALYRQSLLDFVAQGRNDPSGQVVDLAGVVTEVGQGWSPRCHNHPAGDETTWAVIKTTAIQEMAFSPDENKELPSNLEPRPHLELKSGDLLMTRAGPRKRVGVACLVRKVRPKLMLCDKAYRLTLDRRKVVPEFLELVLNAPRIQREIESLKSGINDSGVNLTQKRLLSLQICLPSLERQAEIVRILEERLSRADALEAEIDAALARAEALRQAILKRAFSGRLVPQDPSDEPATTLLTRLRAQRDAAPKTKRTRRKAKA